MLGAVDRCTGETEEEGVGQRMTHLGSQFFLLGAVCLVHEDDDVITIREDVGHITELKDGCDALVGAIFNAQMNYIDVPQHEYFTELQDEKQIDYNIFIDTEQEGLIDL